MSYPGYPPYPPHSQGPGQYSQQPQPYQSTTPLAYPVYPGSAAPPGPISGYPSNNPYPSNPSYPPNPSPYPSNPSPYPPNSSPYPPNSSPYPSNPSPYPSNPSPYSSNTSPYPSNPSPYPPSQTGYPAPGLQSSQYASSQYAPPPQSGHQAPYSSHQPPRSHSPYGGAATQGQAQHSYSKGTPTVRPAQPFDPKADAEVLRKAMKGFGTDEKAIIQVLTNRTNAQRQEIAQHFKTMYGKDLIKDLKSELSGNFEDLIVALMTPIPEFQAKELHHAISGIGTNESTLVELMCSATNHEIHAMRAAYERLYHSSLEQDLGSDTSGSFRRLMISLCQGRRDENYIVDHHAAVMDAQALLNAGELMLGTDESTFNAILCQRSYPQLIQIFMEYQRIAGHGIEKAIRGEFSGDIETGLLAIIKSVKDKAGFFAEQLHDSMEGAGTKDRALIRIVTIRSEIDLEDVKRAFHSKYGKSLAEFIKEDTTGYLEKALLSLIGSA